MVRRRSAPARFALLAALLFLVLPAALFASVKAWRWIDWQRVGANGIVEAETVMIRGVGHRLFVRGHDRGRPVLLFLPGGPGESVVPLAPEFTGELARDFIVAHVEFGVGTAGQYAQGPDFGQFVDDAEAMLDHVRARFPAKPVLLVGHSLGSAQALTIAARAPDKIMGVVTVGQTVDWRAGNRLTAAALRQAATRAGDRATLSALATLPPDLATGEVPPMVDFAAVKRQRELLRAYGMENVLENHTADARLWTYLTAPTHSIAQACNLAWEEDTPCGWIGANPRWWDQWSGVIPGLLAFKAGRDVPALAVPYLAIVGGEDWITPAALTRAYAARLKAPVKRIVTLPSAGHYAHLDDPAAFQRAIHAMFVTRE
jgi:proline iminopeptidase